jgi:TonB family protein
METIYARYPIQSVAAGTVALEVKVDSSGQVVAVKVLRDIASLTPEAVRAIKNWKFEPGTLNGREIPSNVVTAFLFTNPSSLGTPYY